MDNKCIIGVDLGGTNVRAQGFLADGTPCTSRVEIPSNAQDGTSAVLNSLVDCISQVRSESSNAVSDVGLAIPGHVDNKQGSVLWSPNFGDEIDGVFYSWRDVQVKQPLQDRLGLPVTIGNDANCAALGEYWYGAGKGNSKCLVLLTIGTGIGSGVVLGPEALHGGATKPMLFVGGNLGGAELGHTIVLAGGLDCNAGTYGALEGYCQRDSIISRATHRLLRGRDSILNDLTQKDYSKITPRLVAEACDTGDELAIEVYREVGMYLGTAIGSFINIFAPEHIVVAGQISKAGKWLIEPAIQAARNVAIPSLFSFVQIAPSSISDDIGILGAVALATT